MSELLASIDEYCRKVWRNNSFLPLVCSRTVKEIESCPCNNKRIYPEATILGGQPIQERPQRILK